MSEKETEDELVSVAEAREALGISRARMTELIANGDLKTQPSPLDRRVKLVRWSDVEDLARRSGKRLAAA